MTPDPEFNPYAAPAGPIYSSAAPGPIDGPGVWVDGDLLVMTKDATLPDRCIRCNAPAHGYRLRRNLSWHSPAWFLLILVSWLIYLIVALIIRKKAMIDVGLCEVHRGRRRRAIAVGWVLGVLGVGLIAWGLSRFRHGEAVAVAGVVAILAGLIYGVVGSQVVAVKRIDDRLVWLRKVAPEYLLSLASPGRIEVKEWVPPEL